MIVPALYTWIEKGDERPTDGIQGGDIGAFEAVAIETRPRQILQDTEPSMLD
jgi:hypothetical protein